MLSMMLTILAASSAATAPPIDRISKASGAALQADARSALNIIKNLDPKSLSAKDREFLACMQERFAGPIPKNPVAASFPDRVLNIYRSYWRASLLAPQSRAAQETKLDASLRRMVHADKSADLDSLIQKRIEASGGHSLEGRTGLLRELMIWDKQDEKFIQVQLPEGEYRVKVILLNGFRSFGWSHYATCGRRATGGWTTDDALYAVVPRYHSLEGEEFRVTFLGHEAQHFADKSRFKHLEAWELEYRAKLTELALANETRTKVLGKFIEDQGNDPASPHSYANRKLLDDVKVRLGVRSSEELLTIDGAKIQAAAKSILLEDTARRVAAGELKTSVNKSSLS